MHNQRKDHIAYGKIKQQLLAKGVTGRELVTVCLNVPAPLTGSDLEPVHFLQGFSNHIALLLELSLKLGYKGVK